MIVDHPKIGCIVEFIHQQYGTHEGLFLGRGSKAIRGLKGEITSSSTAPVLEAIARSNATAVEAAFS